MSAPAASSARSTCAGSQARPHSTSHARHRRAVALEHLRQPIAEVAGDHDERARAGRGEVGDRRFHPRRAGARRRRGSTRPSPAPNADAEPRAHVVEDRHHLRIEMAEHRGRHRAHDTRGDRGSARDRAAAVPAPSYDLQHARELRANLFDARRAAAARAGHADRRRCSRQGRAPPSSPARRSRS